MERIGEESPVLFFAVHALDCAPIYFPLLGQSGDLKRQRRSQIPISLAEFGGNCKERNYKSLLEVEGQGFFGPAVKAFRKFGHRGKASLATLWNGTKLGQFVIVGTRPTQADISHKIVSC